MRPIEPTLTTELEHHIGSKSVGKAPPYEVNSYRNLVEHVAHLAYLNKDNLLFFRGQTQDFLNKAGASTFYPSIYREDNLAQREVEYRFALLDRASRQLKELFSKGKIDGHADVGRKRYIQWSILQHYGICLTPLLDFTHSPWVACSFAQEDNDKSHGYVYVFGLPYLTNRISINSEHDIVNIRLLSICPPDALRPYFQEGYLAGTSDVTTDYDSKPELDFNNRLIAKFCIPNTKKFWNAGIGKIPRTILYPKSDRIQELCENIETTVRTEIYSGTIGDFITEWVNLEQVLVQKAQKEYPRPLSAREAIQRLQTMGMLDKNLAYTIDELRKFRNLLVHEPDRVDQNSITQHQQELQQLRKKLKWY
ncbi:MAG: FRG domain-containing protein [Chloroflexi bacterium]|nr:FRG domain-containing protein [Chloroflexota bacterium]